MLGNTFYHSISRKCLVAFGKLFSDIEIERTDLQGVVQQKIAVPVSYGNKEKWLARLTEEATIEKRVLITLPRIGFELVGMQYDASRKLNKATQLRGCSVATMGQINAAYAPVPWNIEFLVYIVTKTQDDALRIVEQILPFFTPAFTMSVNIVPELDLVQDIPVVLNSLNISDSFDGQFEARREIIYTLSFTLKTEFLGPIEKSSVILHTRTKVDPGGNILREHNSDVIGTLDNYQIVDEWFDIGRQ